MTIQAVLLDLDETLAVETDSVEAAFLATCELARARHYIEPPAQQLTTLSQLPAALAALQGH